MSKTHRTLGKMRPVVVYAPTPSGGHARYVHELLSALGSLDPHLDLTLVTSAELDGRYRTRNYNIEACLPYLSPIERRRPRSWPGAIRRRIAPGSRPETAFLRWRAGGTSPAIVHLQEFNPALLARGVRGLRERGDAVFVTVHNVRPHERGLRAWIDNRLERRGWRAATGLLVHTEANARRLRQAVGNDVPIFVVGHGIWGAERVDIPPDPRTVLFFGATRANKGLHVLLAALRELPDVRLLVAGPGGSRRYERRLDGATAPVASRVDREKRYIDDDEIPRVFAQAAAVVMPYTRFDAQSGVLYLALAHRKPVVVSDVGGLRDIVETYDVGVVVPPRQATALAQAISAILGPANNDRLCRNIDTAAHDLTWDLVAARTLAAYSTASC